MSMTCNERMVVSAIIKSLCALSRNLEVRLEDSPKTYKFLNPLFEAIDLADSLFPMPTNVKEHEMIAALNWYILENYLEEYDPEKYKETKGVIRKLIKGQSLTANELESVYNMVRIYRIVPLQRQLEVNCYEN